MSAAADPSSSAITESPEPDEQRPAGRGRARVFIAVVVLAQLLIPLTYYLRDDPYDERFAWRMFSGVRLQQCEGSVLETVGDSEGAVNPYEVVPAGWVNNLERNRRPVVERYLALRCEDEGMTRVRFENRCQEVDGTPLPLFSLTRDCATGELTP